MLKKCHTNIVATWNKRHNPHPDSGPDCGNLNFKVCKKGGSRFRIFYKSTSLAYPDLVPNGMK